MPKKTKTAKTSSKPSSRAKIKKKEDVEKIPYAELVARDPDFRIGKGSFLLPNGDRYEGEYYAHARGLIWRQGQGTYFTKDGQQYSGEWDGDKLVPNEEVQISYPDGSKYTGPLINNKYSGCGIYNIEENVSVTCNFEENKPSGEITLIDPKGKIWHGFADKDDSLLVQEHPFYINIGKDLGKGRSKPSILKRHESETANDKGVEIQEPQKELKYSDLRYLENEIFKKSIKVPLNNETENTEWYQSYSQFYNDYWAIVHKAKTSGETSLTESQHQWYQKYKGFEKKIQAALKRRSLKIKEFKLPENDLFQLLHSEKYKILNEPVVPVFIPKDLDPIGEDCDSNCKCP